VANIPVDMSEHALRSVFARWGVVERIQYTGGRGADGLEMAVLGIEPDSEDEDGDGDDEGTAGHGTGNGNGIEGGEEGIQGDEEGGIDGASGAKFIGDLTLPRRQRKRLNKLPASVTPITPLPALDPRTTANPESLGDAYHPSGQRCAHVVYLDSTPLSSLLSPPSPHSVIPIKADSNLPTGLPYYLALHASLRPSLPAVRAFADTSMARFDHLTSLLLSSRAKAQGAGALVDEDGFTVVVRSGKSGRTGGLGDGTRKGTTSIGVASRGFAKKALGQDAAKKGKGAQELPDFYKFQKMERKRQGMSGSIVSAVQQFAAVIRVKEADKK
jgi:ribosomal RNA-processing protein 7